MVAEVISYEIAIRRMPLDLTDDKSTLVQVMAWCHQATSHYLSQCWPRSLSPYGVTRPQWVKRIFFIETFVFLTEISLKSVPLNPVMWSWLGNLNGLAPNRRQANVWTNDDTVHWSLYASINCLNGSRNDSVWGAITSQSEPILWVWFLFAVNWEEVIQ